MKTVNPGWRGSVRKDLIAVTAIVTLLLLLGAGILWAHLDPPGPPAWLERIDIIGVWIVDDLDHGPLGGPGGPGEISLTWQVQAPRPVHPAADDRFLTSPPAGGTTSVNAHPKGPGPVNLFPAGLVLWRMRNCTPLERPVWNAVDIRDDDAPFGFESLMNVGFNAAPGVNFFANGNAVIAYSFDWIRIPHFDSHCEVRQPRTQPGEENEREGQLEPLKPGSYAPIPSRSRTEFVTAYTNTGQVADSVIVEVIAPEIGKVNPRQIDYNTFRELTKPAPTPWFHVDESPRMPLLPGESGPVKFTAAPDAAAAPGYYRFELQVKSASSGKVLAQEGGIVHIVARHE